MNRIIICLVAAVPLAIPSQAKAELILDLSPDVGTVSMAGSTKIVGVEIGTTVNFTVTASSTAGDTFAAFQLNFANSSIGPNELTLTNWASGASWSDLDSVLNSAVSDTFIGGAVFSGSVSTPTVLGTFQVTVPNTPGQFALTVNRVSVDPNFDTSFADENFLPLAVAQFGDVMVNAVPEPSMLILLATGAIVGSATWLLRRRGDINGT